MKQLKKIMVACDFSDYSEETLAYAATLADNAESAELVAVNVINQRDVDTILKVAQGQFNRSVEKYIEQSAKDFVKNVTEERSGKLDEMIAAVGCDHLSVKKVFRTGEPFLELLKAIEKEKPDLMVMGPKGRNNITGVLFGFVAEKMFRRCPVPLLSVRPLEG